MQNIERVVAGLTDSVEVTHSPMNTHCGDGLPCPQGRACFLTHCPEYCRNTEGNLPNGGYIWECHGRQCTVPLQEAFFSSGLWQREPFISLVLIELWVSAMVQVKGKEDLCSLELNKFTHNIFYWISFFYFLSSSFARQPTK